MWQKPLLAVVSVFILSTLSTIGCTSTEPKGNTDPIVPEMDSDTPYPEDPDLGPAPGEEESAVEEPMTPEEDTPGELTEDPYGAPDTDTSSGVEVPGSEFDTDIGSAFEDPQPNYEPAPDAGVPSVGTPFSEAEDDDDIAPSTGMQVRYVKAILLNVRQEPNFRSPIVRRLLGGAKVHVEISGNYAKIRDGQWVHIRYLSSKPTKKVSWKEVQAAWKKSKYKDTWKPPQR